MNDRSKFVRLVISFLISIILIQPITVFADTNENGGSWMSSLGDFFSGVGDTIGEWIDNIKKQEEEEEKEQQELIQQIVMVVGIVLVVILALYFGSKMFKSYTRRKKEEAQEKRAEERAERQQKAMAQLANTVNSENIRAPKF